MFLAANWDAPFDFTAFRADMPPDMTCRGMFISDLVGDLTRAGHPPKEARSYVAFRSYPLAIWVDLVEYATHTMFVGLPQREALRRIGHTIYPRFADTLIGRSIFAIAGREFPKITRLASKAFDVSLNRGKITVTDERPGYSRLALRDLWVFVDTLQIGNWEGVMKVCGVKGEIQVEQMTACDANLEITWQTI
jgi:uncharacterized protein (TIGR02265 family)